MCCSLSVVFGNAGDRRWARVLEPVSRPNVRRSGGDESDRIWVVYGHLATWQQHDTVFEQRYELTSPCAALLDFVQRTWDVRGVAIILDRFIVDSAEDVVIGPGGFRRRIAHGCESTEMSTSEPLPRLNAWATRDAKC